MKYIPFFLLFFMVTACVKTHQIEFEGKVSGVKDGVFIIKTTGDSTVYGENIKDGKFIIAERQLKYPDYYSMSIIDNDNKSNQPPFEIYLEDGKYSIETEKGKLSQYPKIISSSKLQQELSAYYVLYERLIDEFISESKKQKQDVISEGSNLSKDAYLTLLSNIGTTAGKLKDIGFLALGQYAKAYPQSVIGPHIMAKLDYETDPIAYNNLYNTFSTAAKNTDEGKELGVKLSHLVKLVEGAKAPVIYGKTLDGKPFDQGKINNKVILVDFWRADNEISRRNHQIMIDFLKTFKNPEKFGIVSVSIDSKLDWWITAVNEDHITWTQVSDLKGDDTPNAVNWSIAKIPTYFLVNSNWEIINKDLSITRLDFEVNDYLNHHK